MEPFFFLGFGATLVPLVLLILALVLIVGGRKEPDPEHQRPPATYYALVQFLTIFVVLFAVFGVATSLLRLTTDDDDSSGGFRAFNQSSEVIELDQDRDRAFARFDRVDEDDEDASNAVRGLIVAVVAGAIYLVHERRRPRFPTASPGRRVWVTSLYAVCFVAMLTAASAAVAALFNAWDAIAPGVTNAGPRSESLRDMGALLILTAGALAILWRHLRWAEPRPPAPAPTGFALPPAPPSPPPPPRPPAARPPRPRPPAAKRAAAPRKKSAG